MALDTGGLSQADSDMLAYDEHFRKINEIADLKAELAECCLLANRILQRNQGGYIGDRNDVRRIAEISGGVL
jgi:hypothetical protein